MQNRKKSLQQILKIRPENEHQYNSPWNIAADFNIDMSFSIGAIESMLKEYGRGFNKSDTLFRVRC